MTNYSTECLLSHRKVTKKYKQINASKNWKIKHENRERSTLQLITTLANENMKRNTSRRVSQWKSKVGGRFLVLVTVHFRLSSMKSMKCSSETEGGREKKPTIWQRRRYFTKTQWTLLTFCDDSIKFNLSVTEVIVLKTKCDHLTSNWTVTPFTAHKTEACDID